MLVVFFNSIKWSYHGFAAICRKRTRLGMNFAMNEVALILPHVEEQNTDRKDGF